MNTEMVAYREGGWNTSPHKLPGQTDFSPLTHVDGRVLQQAPAVGPCRRRCSACSTAAARWACTGGLITEFRYDLVVRVLGHPVTAGPRVGLTEPRRPAPCWLTSSSTAGRPRRLLGAQRLGQRHRRPADDGPPRGLRRLLRQRRSRPDPRLIHTIYQGALIVTDMIPTPAEPTENSSSRNTPIRKRSRPRPRQIDGGRRVPLIQDSVDPHVDLPRGLMHNGTWQTRAVVRELTGRGRGGDGPGQGHHRDLRHRARSGHGAHR